MDLTVGNSGADINGDTQLPIQAALDRVAESGGGAVALLPGTFVIWDRLILRTGTTLAGSGESSRLVKADGWDAPLSEDGDWGNVWLTCTKAPPVKPGHGVQITSDRDGGWNTTVATVLDVAGNRMRLSHRFNGNHMVHDNARVSSAHSIIDIEEARDVCVRDLAIEGNAARNARTDGCRGGGIHGLFAHNVTISGVAVRDFNGDAISWQACDDWRVENCVTERNRGHGLHPGTGAQRPIVRGCVSRANGDCGMFVCWRVRHAVFENLVFDGNRVAGISIGHKDSDNVFRKNRITNNAGPGLLVRNEKPPMCPDRCTYEGNEITGNNGGGPQVIIHGEVRDLVFRENTYDPAAPRFEIAAGAVNINREKE